MKKIILVLIISIFLSKCSKNKTPKISSTINLENVRKEIPDILTLKKELLYDAKKSIWTSEGKLYSGFAVSYYPNNLLKQKFGILNGKKHLLENQWFKDGFYKQQLNYLNGKLNGDKKSWSADSSHTLLTHFKFLSGKPHGKQIKWYPTGELFKIMHLNMGKEEGLQQAFRKNGDLYANYEAKEGRIFGLKKAKLCYSLKDEKIKSKK